MPKGNSQGTISPHSGCGPLGFSSVEGWGGSREVYAPQNRRGPWASEYAAGHTRQEIVRNQVGLLGGECSLSCSVSCGIWAASRRAKKCEPRAKQ